MSNKSIEVIQAWNSQQFDKVLSLLQEDSEFPQNFDVTILKDDKEDEKRLLKFVEERNMIHQSIIKDDVKELETLIFCIKSKLYLNSKNQSALFTAIWHKKLRIYAFLKSVGVQFKDESEEGLVDGLDGTEKTELENHLVHYFPRNPNAHIYYLISKSRPSNPVQDFEQRVKTFYETLDKVPQISKILQVIQYADFLDVVFDFDKENILDVTPNATETTRGETRYKDGRLYIAAGQKGDNKILGTIAHELTHMAMEIVYGNDCDPYFRHKTEDQKTFNDAAKSIMEKSKNPGEVIDDIAEVIQEGFRYDARDHHSELIARIPHILAQFHDGREWLNRHAPTLMDYFNNSVLAECQKLIDQSYLLKPRNQIQIINEKLGEIQNIQNSCVYFKDVQQITDFINKSTENLMLIKGENTWLTLLKVLQGLYGKDYKNEYSNYLVMKFDVFVNKAVEIIPIFLSPACNTLIIDYSEDSKIRNKTKLIEDFDWIFRLRDERPDKKIIIIIQNEMEAQMTGILNEIYLTYECKSDDCVTLQDLDDLSQELVLNKLIYFQGNRKHLRNIVKVNIKIKSLIDGTTITDLILDRKIEVGSKSQGLAGLDNAYADMEQEINIDILVDLLLNSTSTIFIFEGFNSLQCVESMIQRIKNIKSLEKTIQFHLKEVTLLKDHYTDQEFKNLCRDNPEKDVYWIQSDGTGNETSLTLRKLYTPQFCIGRYFLMREKIVIRMKKIEELSKCDDTICLISNTDAQEFHDFYKSKILNEKNKLKKFSFNLQFLRTLLMKVKYKQMHLDKIDLESGTLVSDNDSNDDSLSPRRSWNVTKNDSGDERKTEKPEILLDTNMFVFIKTEEEAKKRFQELLKSGKTIYWLKKLENDIIYMNSCGSLVNLKKHIDEEKSEKSIVSESDLVKHIQDNKVLIVSDDPGTGKSTTLAKLSDSGSVFKTHWIIKIAFKVLLENLKKIDTVKDAVTLLCKINPNLGNNLARIMLQAALDPEYGFSLPVLFVFDGFNEVLDAKDRENIILLLKLLNEKTEAKLLVTTRPHFKETLENSLSTFAFVFQPMDAGAKKEFVTKHLKIRFHLTFREEIWQDQFSLYVETFLSEVEAVVKSDKMRFGITPLHIYLLLEDVTQHFKNWDQHQNHDPISFHLGKNIFEIYSNYISKKYDYYNKIKKKGKDHTLKEISTTCDLFHMQLAEALTLNSNREVLLSNFEGIAPSSVAFACGIVKCENGHLHFIHSTFQEYYAAKLFIKWIKEPVQRKNILKKLFESILVDAHYEVIRSFLDCQLDDLKIPNENISKSTKILVTVLRERDKESNPATALDVAIREGLVNVFNFVLHILLKEENLLGIKCRFGDTALIYACRCNKTRIVESVLKICEDKLDETQFFNFLTKRGQSKDICLHHGALYNNTEIIKLILDQAKQKLSEKEFYDLFDIRDDFDNTPLHLAASYLAPIFSAKHEAYLHFLEFKSLTTDQIYSNEYSFPELPYSIINKEILGYLGLEKNDIDGIDFLLLNSIVRRCKNELQFSASPIFHTITEYNSGDKSKILSMLQAKNLRGGNVFHYAISNADINLVKLILRKIEETNLPSKETYNFLFSPTNDGYNALHISSVKGDLTLTKMVIELIQKVKMDSEEVLFSTTSLGLNSLHLATFRNHFHVVEALLQSAKEKSETFQYKYTTAASISEENINAIHLAAFVDEDILPLMLNTIPTEKMYDTLSIPWTDSLNALHNAIISSKVKNITFILDKLEATTSPCNFETFLLSKIDDNINALHLAILVSQSEILKILLQYAARQSPEFLYKYLTSEDKSGYNVLHVAVKKGDREAVELILNQISTEKTYEYLSLSGSEHCNALHISAGEGSNDMVQLILEKLKSESLTFQYEYLTLKMMNYGLNALHAAVIGDHLNVVELLLNEIPTKRMYEYLSLSGSQGLNALHLSAANGNSQIVKLILEKLQNAPEHDLESFLLSEDTQDNNALHFAAQNGHLDVLKLLLQYAGEQSSFQYKFLTSANEHSRTVLHIAAFHGHRDAVELILNKITAEKIRQYVSLADSDNFNPLHLAVDVGSCDIVELILNQLKSATTIKDLETILLTAGREGYNALHLAAINGHLEILKALLEYAAGESSEFSYKYLTSATDKRHNVLHIAAFRGHQEISELIIKQIPMERIYEYLSLSECENLNALHLSVANGSGEIVQQILDKLKETSSINLKNFLFSKAYLGMNALHYAASRNQPKVIKILLEYGAEFQYDYLTSVVDEKNNALHIAAIKGHVDIVNLILKEIPEEKTYQYLSLSNANNFNALHFAVYADSREMVIVILDRLREAPAYHRENFLLSEDDQGLTALHFAAGKGNAEIFQILLQYAAEQSPEFQYKYITSATSEGYNAFHIAALQGHKCIVDLILRKIPITKMYEFLCLSDSSNRNAFHKAIEKGNRDIVTLILQHLKSATSPTKLEGFLFAKIVNDNHALHLAVKSNQCDIARILVKEAEEISPETCSRYVTAITRNRQNAIHIAIQKNNEELAQWMSNKIQEKDKSWQCCIF